MREIKFRAWVDHAKAMIYFGLGENNLSCVGKDGEWYSEIDITSIPVMQFTGLHDKNDVPIYEGDRLRVNSTYETDEPIESEAEVKFGEGVFETDFHGAILRGLRKGNWECEVIGNIYEVEG